MGKLIYFVAGSELRTFPGKQRCPLMINVPEHCLNTGDIERTRLLNQMVRPAYEIQDSGGFQILQEELKALSERPNEESVKVSLADKLHPSVIAGAAARMNPTVMIALDKPVQNSKDPREREAEFKAKFDFNVAGTIDTFKEWKKQCPQVAFFVPFQGFELSHLHKFLEAIKGISFHGFCMPLRNMNLHETGLFLTRFWQLGVKNVHLLGSSKAFSIALAAYGARHLFNWISLDSQTWHSAACHSEYLNPCDLSRVKVTQDVIMPEGTELDCRCPFCRGRTFAYIQHLPFDDRRVLLSGHNHFVTVKAFRDLYDHAGSIRTLVSFVDSRSRNKKRVQELYDTLCLIETFKDKDLRYFADLIPKKGAK
jgi:queuine/archaeosine tRNA-ribosyltransferase